MNKVEVWANTLIGILTCVAAALILAGAVVVVFPAGPSNDLADEIPRRFNLDGEGTVPAWFSSIALMLCAQVLFVVSMLDRRSGELRYWQGLSLIFIFLSMDEVASFHEAFILPLREMMDADGFFFFTWVVPAMAGLVLLLAVLWAFLNRLPPATKWGFIFAGAVFCTGAIGMEMISGSHYAQNGENADFTFGMMTVVEEALEISGAILFLRELLRYSAEQQRLGWPSSIVP